MDQCAGCCGTPGMTWSCNSLTGTAYLYGFSGYSSDAAPYDVGDPGEWEGQYRKWSTRTFSGQNTVIDYAETGCAGDCVSQGNGTSEGGRFSGSAVIDETGAYSSYGVQEFVNSPCSPTTWFVNSTTIGNIVSYKPNSSCADYVPIYTIQTLIGRDNISCGCILNFFTEEPGTRSYNGTLSVELSDERSFYKALELQDAEAVAGESCCTELTEAPLTEPETSAPIQMSGTGVEVPISILNPDSGSDYSVTVHLSQANPDPDPPTEWTVDLVIPGDAPDYNYYPPLPSPGDFPICVVDVVFNGEI